jgi:hypothetical protein
MNTTNFFLFSDRNNVKKLREQHEEDLERQRKFYKTQIETLMTLVKNQQAEDDSEDEVRFKYENSEQIQCQ